MKALSQEELRELRADFTGRGKSDAELDDLILFFDRVVISFISQSKQKHPVQLSLSQRANTAFAARSDCDMLPTRTESEPVDLRSEGSKNTKSSRRDFQP